MNELLFYSDHADGCKMDVVDTWVKKHPHVSVRFLKNLDLDASETSNKLLVICGPDPDFLTRSLAYLITSKTRSKALSIWIGYSTAHPDDVSNWFHMGVTDTLHYPFSEGEIHSKLDRFFSKRIHSTEVYETGTDDLDFPFWHYTNDAILVYPLEKSGLGKFVQVNQTAIERYGYTQAEFRTLDISDINSLEGSNASKIADQMESLKKSKRIDVETIHRKKDGSLIPVEVSARIILLGGSSYVLSVARDIRKRIAVQKELQKHESLLSTAINVGKMAYWQYEKETDEFLFNDAFYALFGTTVEQQGGYRMKPHVYAERFVHPDEQYIVGHEIYKEILQASAELFRELTHQFFYADGSLGHMFVRYNVRKEDGNLKVLGICQDITGQKQAELENLKNKRQMEITQMGIDLSNVAIFQVNDTGMIEYVNDYACRSYGFKREEFLQMHITNLDPDIGKVSWAHHRMLAQKEGGSFFESRHRCKDGRILNVEISVHYFEYAGRLMSFSFVKDLTEQKRQQRMLEESERRFREILTSTPTLAVQGIYEDGTIFFWNDANSKITGYTPDEAIGKNIIDLIVPKQHAGRARDVLRTIAKGETHFSMGEITLQRKDGNPVTVYSSRTMVRMNNQLEIYTLHVDLTQVKAAEMEKERAFQAMAQAKEQAEHANKAKDDFLAVMSHEMRTPLNPIMGFSNLLRNECAEENKEYLDIIYESAKRLHTLINNILDYIRIGKEQTQPESVEFNLYDRCQMGFNNARQYKPGLDYLFFNGFSSFEPIPKQLSVFDDEQLITRILDNLLINACKYTPEGSVTFRIGIKRNDEESKAIFHGQIDDTGIGIDPHILPQLFQPFTQADKSFSRKTEGVGLGLSICKRLIEMLNGRIFVSSEVGKGTTFKFEIPIHPIIGKTYDHLETGKARMQWMQLPGHPLILIVDDTPNNSKIASVMVSKMGARSVSALDGNEAVKRCCDTQFDLILMDLSMPVMDGFEATRTLRSQPGPNQHTPIIGLSAHVSQKVSEKCEQAGMNGYLEKPVDSVALQNMLIATLSI